MLIRLKANDAHAWTEMVELYAPLIFEWCRMCSLDSPDSADVMQEVFTAASRGVSAFRPSPTGTLRGWLWTITQNKIRDHHRRGANREAAIGGTQANIRMTEFSDESVDEEPTTDLQSHRLLHRALDQIKADFAPQTWDAFWRSVVDGHNTHWIAEEIGLSPNGVRQAKSRVLRRLRQQLGEL